MTKACHKSFIFFMEGHKYVLFAVGGEYVPMRAAIV